MPQQPRQVKMKDEQGNLHTVIEKHRKKTVQHFEGPSAVDDTYYETESGEVLKVIAFGMYKVPSTGVILTEVD